jgi:hypothetical protein
MDQDRTTSRRSFLGTAAGATGVALAAAVWKPTQAAAALPQEGPAVASPIAERSYVSGNFLLTLDGSNAGFLKAIDGGYITADVINQSLGASGGITKKHIGSPKYEEFSLQVGFSMTKAFYDWIAASWNMNYTRHDGSVILTDFDYVARSARNFEDALLTETGIPACDGSAKEPGYLTVNFQPEFIKYVPGSGETIDFDQRQQKLWVASNFRLEIDSVDCTRVNKIDAFTIKQGVVTDSLGDARAMQVKPAAPVFPNLKVTFSQVSLPSWMDWFQSFVVQGNNSDAQEKNGRLQLLTPDLGTTLAEIKFFNIGIFKLEQQSSADTSAIARWAAELYVERMEFRYMPPVST